MLPVDNVQEGFLSREAYYALLDALPDRLRLLFVLAFHVGCRRGELLKLTWQHDGCRHPQSHVMYIGGHKTESIFRRFDIMNDDRLTAASVKMQNSFDEKLGLQKAGKDKNVAKSDAKSRPKHSTDTTVCY